MKDLHHRLGKLSIPILGDSLSLGACIIVLIALGSTVLVAMRSDTRSQGLVMWTRARNHLLLYEPAAQAWNNDKSHPQSVQIHLMSDQALERRMLSGFLSKTHVADLIEIERNNAGRVFSGPLEDVGFVDLTERIRQEGLLEQINAPSYSPWTSRGRIFGLPHDVHPLLLAYRADMVEAAGIDVSGVQTWDDLARVLRPMIRDLDGDGQPDRYAINYWHTNMDQTETLILQAGGAYFDDQGRAVVDSDTNAEVAAQLVCWCTGPNRIAIDAPEFTASGNRSARWCPTGCAESGGPSCPDWAAR
jgi:arabinosaccharide transport system substrate-binding protein